MHLQARYQHVLFLSFLTTSYTFPFILVLAAGQTSGQALPAVIKFAFVLTTWMQMTVRTCSRACCAAI